MQAAPSHLRKGSLAARENGVTAAKLLQRQEEALRMEQLDHAITEMVHYFSKARGSRGPVKGGAVGSTHRTPPRLPTRYDVKFLRHEDAQRCVEELPNDAASHGLKAFLGYNDHPWQRRGWGIAEVALSQEISSRARALYPKVTAWLSSLPIAKVYAVDEVGGATEMILERPRQRRQVMRDIRSARFTVNQDQQSVPVLFSECAKRVALAFETAEATREQALLEASKGHNEVAAIARKELAENRKRWKETIGESALPSRPSNVKRPPRARQSSSSLTARNQVGGKLRQ